MDKRIPAESFPPGDFIREELAERDWTQMDLAVVMDRPISLVNAIINDKHGVTARTAWGLSAAFGTSAEYWMALDAAWRLHKLDRKAPRRPQEQPND